jgi:hypothetical protein
MLDHRPSYLAVPLEWEGRYLHVARGEYWLYKATEPDGLQHFVRGRPLGLSYIEVDGVAGDGVAYGHESTEPVPLSRWASGAVLLAMVLILLAFCAGIFSLAAGAAIGTAGLICLAYAGYQTFTETDEERGLAVTLGWTALLVLGGVLHRRGDEEPRRRSDDSGPLGFGDR